MADHLVILVLAVGGLVALFTYKAILSATPGRNVSPASAAHPAGDA